jgi:nucleotide-binding universal stress UspA family protein
MKRLLVTTDLSKNSKSALRFAIQLASQYKVHLVFFYALELLIPTRWNDVKAKIHMDEEIERETERLCQFVTETYKECHRRPGQFDCVVRYGAPVSQAILEYAREVCADYISIGTRGAGELQQLIGTHASAVIRKSHIPVFVVPRNYRASAIRAILYASDFTALKEELRTVKSVAKKLGSSVSVIHYGYFLEPETDRGEFEAATSRHALPRTTFHLEKINWSESFGWHLNKASRKFKADVVALFTEHGRLWFDRCFKRSHAAEASFDSVKPLLVFPK